MRKSDESSRRARPKTRERSRAHADDVRADDRDRRCCKIERACQKALSLHLRHVAKRFGRDRHQWAQRQGAAQGHVRRDSEKCPLLLCWHWRELPELPQRRQVAGRRGQPIVDPLYAAIFAALVTYVCSRASRETLLVFSVVAVVMSRTWLEIPAVAALLIAFGSLLPKHSRRRVGALIGALGVETMLRWPSVAFHGSTAAVAGAVLAAVVRLGLQTLLDRGTAASQEDVALTGVLAVGFSVPLLLATFLARTDISVGQRAAESAFGDVSGGSAAVATPMLRTATAEFGSASSKLGSWWTSVARVVPVIAQQRQALAAGAATARDVVAVAAREAPSFDYQSVNYHKGQVDLGRISAMLGPAKTLDRSLARATARLAGLQSPWLVGPIQSRLRTFDTDLRPCQVEHRPRGEGDPAGPRHARRRAAPALLPGLCIAVRKSGPRRDRRCLRRAHRRKWSHQSHCLRPCRIARRGASERRRPPDGAVGLHGPLRAVRPGSALPGHDLLARFPHRGPGHLAALPSGRWRSARRCSHGRSLWARSTALDHGACRRAGACATTDQSQRTRGLVEE